MERGDPLSCLDRASRLHELATRRAIRGGVELFHRVTLRARATREALGDSPFLETGSEEGVAVRIRAEKNRSTAFAAASGGDERAVAWAVERASGSRTWRAGPSEAPWPRGDGRFKLDLDPGGAVPGPEALDRWLTGALTDLPRGARGSVEAGLTIESLVNDLGLRAVRLRRRAWASFTCPGPSDNESEQIRTYVGEDLAPLASGIAADGALPLPERVVPAGDDSVPLLLEHEAAATLVRGIGQALHRSSRTLGRPVGPAWKLVEDPQAAGSPFAATFDDAGFDAARIPLADGREVTGIVEGPGCLRRPSFRDPPEPLAMNLVVAAEPGSPPPSFLSVADLRIHGGEYGDWLLELRVASRRGGRGGGRTTKRLLGAKPEDLVLRVTAAVGRPRPTAKGVVTPALVLEGLRLPG